MEINFENIMQTTIENMSEEILIHIFHFLDEKSLCQCAYVNRQWLHCASDGQLWKTRLANPPWIDSNSLRKTTTPTPFPRLFSNNVVPHRFGFKRLFYEFQPNMNLPIVQEGIEASSVDHPEQAIDKTLDENEHTFWSSTGSEDTMKPEHLIYKLVQPVCIVSVVSILPYMASYQQGMPIYAPQQIQISIGFSPKEMHWSSQIFDVANKHDIQSFQILPQVIVGGYVRLDLIGRYQTQPQDDLYYTVLESVRIQGIPLGAISNDILTSSFVNFALEQKAFRDQMKDKFKRDSQVLALLDNPQWKESSLCDLLLLNFKTDILPILNKQSEVILEIVELVKKGQYVEAAKIVGKSDSQIRNNSTFSLFLQCGPSALRPYFGVMLKCERKLTKLESIELIKMLLESKGNLPFMHVLFQGNKLTMSQDLGDMVKTIDVGLAIRIYLLSSVPDKVIECYKDLKQWNKVIHFCTSFKYKVDYLKMLKEIQEKNPGDAIQFAVFLAEQKGGSPVELDEVCKVLSINTTNEWDLRKLLKKALDEHMQRGTVSPPQVIEDDMEWEEDDEEEGTIL